MQQRALGQSVSEAPNGATNWAQIGVLSAEWAEKSTSCFDFRLPKGQSSVSRFKQSVEFPCVNQHPGITLHFRRRLLMSISRKPIASPTCQSTSN